MSSGAAAQIAIPAVDSPGRKCWYPIRLELEYRLFHDTRVIQNGIGRTIWVSSEKVTLHSEGGLVLGKTIELTVAWPVKLSYRVGLKLVIVGQTTRVEGKIGRAS